LAQDTTETGLYSIRESGAMCVLPKAEK
jgi:hypothetical protein